MYRTYLHLSDPILAYQGFDSLCLRTAVHNGSGDQIGVTEPLIIQDDLIPVSDKYDLWWKEVKECENASHLQKGPFCGESKVCMIPNYFQGSCFADVGWYSVLKAWQTLIHHMGAGVAKTREFTARVSDVVDTRVDTTGTRRSEGRASRRSLPCLKTKPTKPHLPAYWL